MASALREFFRIPRQHRLVSGIDIGSHAVKVVSLQRTKSGRPKLVYAAKEIIEPGGLEDRHARETEALRKALGRRRGRLGWVVVAFPRELTSARIINLPTIQPAEVSEMVQFDAERHIPFAIDEAEVSHQVLAQHENYTSDVLLVGARRNDLQRFLDVFRGAGIDPDFISVNAVGNCRPFALGETDGRTVAVLDIGRRSTDLAVFRNRRPQFSRTLLVGTGRLEQYIEAEGRAPEAAVDATQWDFGRDGAEENDPERRWLSELIPELKRTFQAFQHEPLGGGSIDRIIVCGGLAHATGVEEKLKEELGIETMVARDVLPSRVEGGKIGSLDPEMASAVGVALDVFDSRQDCLNLLPQGVVEARRREHNRGFIRQAATLMVMIGLLVGGIIFNNYNLQSKKIAFWEDRIAELRPRVSKAYDMKEELAILDSLRDQEITAYRVLRELYRETPERIQIEDYDFTKARDEREADTLRLTGKAFNTQEVLSYAQILLGSQYVASVEPVKEYPITEFGIRLRRFELKAVLAKSLREGGKEKEGKT
jgi:type IV pilus assembly protein PilM